MRAEGTWLAALLILAAGCLAPAKQPEVLTASAAAPAEASWSNATRVFDVPKGDSFGVLDVSLGPEEAGHVFSAPTVGIEMVAKDKALRYAGLTLFVVKEGALRFSSASGTMSGPDGTSGSAGGVGVKDAPVRFVAIAAFHAEAATQVRMAAWKDSNMSLPRDEVPGRWNLSGPANVSYFLSALELPPTLHGESYGVSQSGTGLLADGVAQAGELVLTTDHHVAGRHFDLATALVWGGYGAGVVDATFAAGANRTAKEALWASADVGFSGAADAMGVFDDATSFGFSQRGAATTPIVLLTHETVPFDPASWNLTLANQFGVGAIEVPGSAGPCLAAPGGTCMTSAPKI